MSNHRQQRHPSPQRNRRHQNRAHASTGSLPQTPAENYYGAPVAPAPPPISHPPHNYPRGGYSGPGSPQSSEESLNEYYGHSVPPTPGYGPMNYHPGAATISIPPPPPPPPMAPAPAPGPPPGMRGGDGHTHNRMGSLGRQNTQSNKQHHPNIIHQHHPQLPQEYNHDPHPDMDYRQHQHPQRPAPVNTRQSRSSSRNRDMSPPDSAGPYVMTPGASTAGRTQSTYHSGSSNFSGNSYDFEPPYDRPHSYVVPNASHAHGGPQYHLDGPLPGEREYGRQGTVYHPAGGNRPVLGEHPPRQQRPPRRERSRSRGPHHGLGLMDGSDEHYDEQSLFNSRPGGRRPAAAANTPEKGALVRSRSRSVPAGDSRALMAQRKAPSSASSEGSSASDTQPERGIRLEYGGQSVDITYTGRGGKPLNIGSITINTTSRSTTTVPAGSNQRAIAAPPATKTPPPAAIMPPPETAPAPAPAPAPAAAPAPARAPTPAPPPVPQAPAPPPAPPAPSVLPVMIPPPPAPGQYIMPPGVEPLILPPPPPPPLIPPAAGTMLPMRRGPGSENDMYMDDELYPGMENLGLEGPQSPYYQDRGRERDVMGSISGPRESSRRRRSVSRHRKSMDASEPRWTKISRDIVARRAVEVIGYDFKEQKDSIMVFQVLNEAQIDQLIELSEQIRSGAVRVIRRERSPKREDGKEHRHHRRHPSQSRQNKPRPVSVHGYPSGVGPGPGPSANRPPPGKPAIVTPTAPDPPREAPAPAPAPPAPKVSQAPPRRPVENPDQPGTYIGYSRNPPRSAASSAPFHRHGTGKRPN